MTREDLITALNAQNVRPFLHAIRLGEGTADEDGYRRIVGGELFDSFAHHPRRAIWIPRYGVWSTAAGAYQLIKDTWVSLVRMYGFEDFSPDNQDQAAVALIAEKGALDDVISGEPMIAAHKCREVWASLPDSMAGQRAVSAQQFLSEYEKWGGVA